MVKAEELSSAFLYFTVWDDKKCFIYISSWSIYL